MKTYADKLRECSIETLKILMARQQAEMEIIKRDLLTMESVLAERTAGLDAPRIERP